MRPGFAVLALLASACDEAIQTIDRPWPSDRTVVLVQLPDGAEPTVRAYGPGATIEIEVSGNRSTRLIAYTYDGALAEDEDPVRCGVSIGDQHPIPLLVRGVWASPAVDLGSGDVELVELSAPERPAIALSYTNCLSDDVDCPALLPEASTTPIINSNLSLIALVTDDLLFYALDRGDDTVPAFQLYRHERGVAEHVKIDPPPALDENIKAIAYFQGEIVVVSNSGRTWYYSTGGALLREGNRWPATRSLAVAGDLLVHFGDGGVVTEPPDAIGPLPEVVQDLVLVDANRAAAVTDGGLRVWEGGRWHDRSRGGALGFDDSWRVGMDESVIVAVSEAGDIAVRTEPEIELQKVESPLGPGSNLRGAVGLGGGRWLVTAENGQLIVHHRAGTCTLTTSLTNNLRRPYRLPMGHAIWIGANDVGTVFDDTPLLVRIPLPVSR